MYLVTHFLTTPQQTDIFEFLKHVIFTTSPASSTVETLRASAPTHLVTRHVSKIFQEVMRGGSRNITWHHAGGPYVSEWFFWVRLLQRVPEDQGRSPDLFLLIDKWENVKVTKEKNLILLEHKRSLVISAARNVGSDFWKTIRAAYEKELVWREWSL